MQPILLLVLGLLHYSTRSPASPTKTPIITSINNESQCHCFPGDLCWPSTEQWAAFNSSLGGKLIATRPLASPCHLNDGISAYNEKDCERLREKWMLPQTHYSSSSSIMMPFFANQSCDPYLPPDSPCRIGTYVRYSVRAEDVKDIQRTISFVKENNIRLVVRNTGHDYLGKSTGPGAVAVWTHHMKDIEVLEYSSINYTGKAMRFGAGVQIFEAMAAAHEQGLVVVAGNCRTVGIAGGYTQGGGHGQLASRFGLAVDQVLEWEVVTGTGELVRSWPQGEHADLYWALAGGGGGSYGVVVSMTVKTYPEMRTVAANLTFVGGGTSQEAFRRAVETFIVQIGPLIDARGASVWFVTRDSFSMTPASITGATKEELQWIFDPVIAELKRSNLTYCKCIASPR